MTQRCHSATEHRAPVADANGRPSDWAALGRRLRQAAFVAATVHLVQSAGGRLDDGAALETSRDLDGG